MSSGFISEAEIAEQRRARQEEWEKVRKPDQPEEVPEEVYDHRSLFDRLEEQKQKKEMEYEEAHKLKNMVKGLDDDEVDFLEQVERRKMDAELRTSREEARELKAFRDAVAQAEEDSLNHRIQTEIKARPVNVNPSRSSQGRLLAGAVVRKRPANETEDAAKKLCTSDISGAKLSKAAGADNDDVSRPEKRTSTTTPEKGTPTESKTESSSSPDEVNSNRVTDQNVEAGSEVLKCIGILPGLGSYPDSSDSEASSDTDTELAPTLASHDLLGRQITRRTKGQRAATSH